MIWSEFQTGKSVEEWEIGRQIPLDDSALGWAWAWASEVIATRSGLAFGQADHERDGKYVCQHGPPARTRDSADICGNCTFQIHCLVRICYALSWPPHMHRHSPGLDIFVFGAMVIAVETRSIDLRGWASIKSNYTRSYLTYNLFWMKLWFATYVYDLQTDCSYLATPRHTFRGLVWHSTIHTLDCMRIHYHGAITRS